MTRCGQIRQPQAYLGTRHSCRLFYSYPPKIGMTSCLALQELYATVTHFSLSGYELFKLTFKLHSGTISPNSTPDRILKSYLLDRPALRSYENQTRVFGTTFDRKERQTEPKPVKEKLLAEKHPRGFKEPPVTCSTPEQAHYLPLPAFPQVGTGVQMAINVLRSLKGYFGDEKRRIGMLCSLVTAACKYFTCYFSVLLVN